MNFRYVPRFEYTPDLTEDGSRLAVLLYGPFVMATYNDAKDWLTLDAQQPPVRIPERFVLRFCGREFFPMYEIHGRPYHTYFKLKT